MAVVNKSALVPYRATEMYALVADVEHYPEFLPWCADATVHYRRGREVRASLVIARGPIRKSFTTLNRMTSRQSIELQLVDGPFKHLHGRWDFTACGDDGCRVALQLDFAFSTGVLQKLLNPLFSEIANSMVDAFCKRAEQIYGPG